MVIKTVTPEEQLRNWHTVNSIVSKSVEVLICPFLGCEQQMVPQQKHLQLRVEESEQRPPAEDLGVAVYQRAVALTEILGVESLGPRGQGDDPG